MIKPSFCIAVDCTKYSLCVYSSCPEILIQMEAEICFVVLYFETESNFVSEASLEFTIVLVGHTRYDPLSQPPGC